MTANGEAWPFPNEPPECLGTTEVCPDCPFAPECGYLAVGQALQEERQALEATHAELAKTRIELEKERAENAQAMHDQLLPGFLTRRGFERAVEQDKALQREILEGRAGVLALDIRGLSLINNEYGHDPIGDNYLRAAAGRLTGNGQPGLVRTKSSDPYIANQRANPDLQDVLFCRPGDRSDEMVGIIRDVALEQFQAVFQRVRNGYSIGRAIEDDTHEKIPIMACVGSAHGMTYPAQPGTGAMRHLKRLIEMADQEALRQRNDQYMIFWGLASEVDPTLQKNYDYVTRDPQAHKDVVMKAFLRGLCPNFARRAVELLGPES